MSIVYDRKIELESSKVRFPNVDSIYYNERDSFPYKLHDYVRFRPQFTEKLRSCNSGIYGLSGGVIIAVKGSYAKLSAIDSELIDKIWFHKNLLYKTT